MVIFNIIGFYPSHFNLLTGGCNFNWIYKMGGMHFNGSSDTTEFVSENFMTSESF